MGLGRVLERHDAESGLSPAGVVCAALLAAGVRYGVGNAAAVPHLLPWTLPLVLLSLAAQMLLAFLVLGAVQVAFVAVRHRVGRPTAWAGLALLCLFLTPGPAFVVESGFAGQAIAELVFVPTLLAGLAATAWCLSVAARWVVRDQGEGAPPFVDAARDLLVPFVALVVAVSGDYHRFCLYSPPVRTYLIALTVLAAGLLVSSALLGSGRPWTRIVGGAGLAGLGVLLVWFDSLAYQRLYPMLHLAAWLGYGFAVGRLAWTWTRRVRTAPDSRHGRRAVTLGAVAVIAAVAPMASDAARFELLERGPTNHSLARILSPALSRWAPPAPLPAHELLEPLEATPGRKTDSPVSLVVICIDALRADRVTEQHMPHTYEFLRGGTIFLRARTPAPSTHPTVAAAFSGTYNGHPTLRDSTTHNPLDEIIIWNRLGAAGYVTEQIGPLKGHPYFERVSRPTERSAKAQADLFLDRLVDLSASPRPFAVWLHLDTPHAPYRPVSETRGTGAFAKYDACVADADHAVGRVLEALRAVEEARPLVVVMFSDHGEEFGEHGGQYHTTTAYDELARVLFAFHGPGIDAQVRDESVSLVDLAPSVLELLGLDVPADLDGRSLAPALRGEPLSPRPVFTDVWLGGAVTSRAVVVEPWKLITNVRSATRELYHLGDDPDERSNRIDDLADTPALLRAASGLTGDDL